MIHNILKDKKVILASQSPRRKIIMEMLGVNALQVPAFIPEETHFKQPGKIVMQLAVDKAMAVAKNMDENCLVIGSDTIVYHRNIVLEKPLDKAEAKAFLNKLSDDFHWVYTSVAIIYKNKVYKDFAKTRVQFKELSEDEIDNYIETGEPMDKAGAYGIQGFGSQFIKNLQGDYFTVMGFPVSLFYEMVTNL